MGSASAHAVEEDLRRTFMIFGADGNGFITAAELVCVLRGLGESATITQCLPHDPACRPQREPI
jgi:Ca2+-binding EF-hand superfamily protein